MDVVLTLTDTYFFDSVYARLLPPPPILSALPRLNATSSPVSYATSTTYHSFLPPLSLLPRDSLLRQSISLFLIALIGAAAIYFLFCSLSYFLVFDRRLEHHPRFLENQVWLEIKSSLIAMPTIDLLTLPWFLAEVRGHSKLYDRVDQYGWAYLVASVGMYLFFTDFCIYWIHRIEHHPRLYKYVHKPHHRWIRESRPACVGSPLLTLSANTMGSPRFPPYRRIRSVPPIPVRPFTPTREHS